MSNEDKSLSKDEKISDYERCMADAISLLADRLPARMLDKVIKLVSIELKTKCIGEYMEIYEEDK